jgi:hypothetical protein
MKTNVLTFAMLGTLLALLPQAAPASATSLETWVANNGTNNGTCSRTSPCDTFQHAHDATTAGGVIRCVNAGSYGEINITKAISIVCDNTQARILSGVLGIEVNAGANDIVTLKGLDIDGSDFGTYGIYFNSGAALHVDKVHIHNFAASGIIVVTTGYAELYVTDSIINESGGIVIAPSGNMNAFLSHDRLENNSVGIDVEGTYNTGVAVNATVSDCVVTGSAGNGIQAVSPAGVAATSVLVDHTVSSGNFGSGINANGATASGQGSAIVRVGDATIVLNVTGISTTGAGVVQSFKNNRISGNLTDGTPIAAYPGPGGTPLQ